MSTSSLYSPEEDDEEATDIGDLEPENLQSALPVSSPRLQELALSSGEDKDPPSRTPSRDSKHIRLRSRANAWRALKKRPIGGYRELYAETYYDISQDSTYHTGGNLPSTQNGVSTWTSLEKDCFFNVLARVGKARVRDIAASIGSKSEMEVRDYMQLLHRGLEHQHLVEANTGAVTLGDIPAALEISEECCEALEQASEVISMEEQRSERVSAKRRHGNMFLIDSDMAEVVEEKLEAEADEELEQSELEKSELDTAARLFNLSNWIKTSERIFMNFGEPRLEDNWVNIKFEDESPSITADALLDFHTLAISLTRRLVQSSLFFAMSRIRAMKSGSNHPLRAVKSRDVTAALNVLRMEQNTDAFWAGVARRCSLNIIDTKHHKGWETVPLDHDQVEERLLGYSFGSRIITRPSAESPLSSSEESSDETEYSDVEDDSSPARAPDSPSPSLPNPSADEDFSDPEEAHASTLDKQASSSEEHRLWQILHGAHSPEPDVQPAHKKLATHVSTGKRKSKQDLVDWRDRICYRSEWEVFGHDTTTIEEEFVEGQRKRPKTDDNQPASEKQIPSIETDIQAGSGVQASDKSDASMAGESVHVSDGFAHSDRMDLDIPSENDTGLTDTTSSDNSD